MLRLGLILIFMFAAGCAKDGNGGSPAPNVSAVGGSATATLPAPTPSPTPICGDIGSCGLHCDNLYPWDNQAYLHAQCPGFTIVDETAFHECLTLVTQNTYAQFENCMNLPADKVPDYTYFPSGN